MRRKLLGFVARQRRQAGDADPAFAATIEHDETPHAEDDAARPPGHVTEDEIEALLDSLAASGLLSEERFTESRIHVRAPRYGNLRIRQELAQHGVTLDADTAQALQASELDRAHAVWARRYGGPASDAAGRARQARFLAARGFSADVVRRVVAGRADPE